MKDILSKIGFKLWLSFLFIKPKTWKEILPKHRTEFVVATIIGWLAVISCLLVIIDIILLRLE